MAVDSNWIGVGAGDDSLAAAAAVDGVDAGSVSFAVSLNGAAKPAWMCSTLPNPLHRVSVRHPRTKHVITRR